MTAIEKYPVRDCVNFWSAIQMELSLKPRIFSDFFVQFLESTSNFKHFKKKMIAIPSLFCKLQNVKDLIRPLSKKHVCRTFFDSQHVKGSKTVVKSAWEHFHQIFASVWETLILKISPYWYVKSWGSFLLDWPPMTNIVFGFAWICCPRFKCNYL